MKKRLLVIGVAAALGLGIAQTGHAWLVDTNVSTHFNRNSNNDSRRIDQSRNENSNNRYDRRLAIDSYNRHYDNSMRDNRSFDDHAVSGSYNTDSRSFDSHAITDSYKDNTFDESIGKRTASHDIGGDARNSVFGDFTQTVGGNNTQTFGDVNITGSGQ